MSEAKDQDLRQVQAAMAMLSEHFETVQIFVTRHENLAGGTININMGSGNFFARLGQARCWLDTQIGRETEKGAQDQRKDDER